MEILLTLVLQRCGRLRCQPRWWYQWRSRRNPDSQFYPLQLFSPRIWQRCFDYSRTGRRNPWFLRVTRKKTRLCYPVDVRMTSNYPWVFVLLRQVSAEVLWLFMWCIYIATQTLNLVKLFISIIREYMVSLSDIVCEAPVQSNCAQGRVSMLMLPRNYLLNLPKLGSLAWEITMKVFPSSAFGSNMASVAYLQMTGDRQYDSALNFNTILE